jgi:DNA-binding protein YbaB
LSNDARRHQFTEVLALAQEQMAEIAAVQRKQARLTATGVAADGLVEVTVNAHGQLVKTVIDESYLDDYEFEELADHITEAAHAAARDVGQRVAEMMVPISERRKRFPRSWTVPPICGISHRRGWTPSPRPGRTPTKTMAGTTPPSPR